MNFFHPFFKLLSEVIQTYFGFADKISNENMANKGRYLYTVDMSYTLFTCLQRLERDVEKIIRYLR